MATNSNLPSKKTDLYPITFQKVKELDRVITNKLNPWKMLNSTSGMHVTDNYGKEISYKGVEFQGSPKLVFWNNFIEPFLENGIMGILNTTYQMCAEKMLAPHLYMNETCEILKSLNQKTYERMSIIDQRLRGKGFPRRVTPVKVDGKINKMNRFVDSYSIAILKRGKESKGTLLEKTIKPVTKKLLPIAILSGTKWEDVKIHFIDTENVNVSVNDKRPILKSYTDLGFGHETRNKSKLAWGTLLCFALEKEHTLNRKTIVNLSSLGIDISWKTLKDRTREINKTLKIIFSGIDENPIYYDDQVSPYGYKPRFQISYNPDIIKYLESLKSKIDEDNNQD